MVPDKLLVFAIEHNGLGEDVDHPWHVKGTFEVNISKVGTQFASGSFEETWYAPLNYRRTYEFKGVSHTDTATPEGLYRSGDQGWSGVEELRVRKLLVAPLPTEPVAANITLRVKDVPSGKASVPCLFEVQAVPAGTSKKDEEKAVDASPRICFDTNAPILRFSAAVGSRDQIAFSKIANLHGHLVAQEIVVTDVAGITKLRVHVTEAAAVPSPDGPMTAPAGATLLKGPVTVPWETLETLPTKMREPVYPAGAIQEKLEDTINLAVDIAPDGTVKSATVLNGMQMLRESAVEYVRQMKFKPFLLGTMPVEVHTEAHITFDLEMARHQRS